MRAIWIRTALLNFLIAALMGAVMRFAFVQEIPWLSYKAFLHGHSHGALLGWLYLMLFSLFIGLFLEKPQRSRAVYHYLFWATQVSVVGMFVSFPLQGYGPVSIFFSSVHILLSYAFGFVFWKDIKGQTSLAARLARRAIFWMGFSTLGVWALGPIMTSALRGSSWYYLAIQFFLHFQFHGWLVFGVLALFFRWLENQALLPSRPYPAAFLPVLSWATLLTYALAVAWSNPHPLVFALNSMGILLQLYALWMLRAMVRPLLIAIRQRVRRDAFWLWQTSLLAFIAKVGIQGMVILPFVARMAYTIRNYVIGFVHLLMLGVLSLFFFALLTQETRIFARNGAHRVGLALFLIGLLLSEGLLFLQGTLFWAKLGFLPHYYPALFSASICMPAGLLVMWAAGLLQSTDISNTPSPTEAMDLAERPVRGPDSAGHEVS